MAPKGRDTQVANEGSLPPPLAGCRRGGIKLLPRNKNVAEKMFFAYIVQSLSTGKYYIGSTKNLERRLRRHNAGFTRSIKNKGPFKFVFTEQYKTRAEAYRREKEIKSYKGGNAFKKLISQDTEVVKRSSL